MAGDNTSRSGGALTKPVGDGWKEHHGNVYRAPIYVTASESGFTARAATLAGIETSGKTEQEAVEAIKSALAKAISAWKANKQQIPWTELPESEPKGASTKWILIRLA